MTIKQKTVKELIIALEIKDTPSELFKKVLQGEKESLEFLKSSLSEKLTEVKELGGSVEIQKIFVTPEEVEAVNRHINEFISDSYTYNR